MKCLAHPNYEPTTKEIELIICSGCDYYGRHSDPYPCPTCLQLRVRQLEIELEEAKEEARIAGWSGG